MPLRVRQAARRCVWSARTIVCALIAYGLAGYRLLQGCPLAPAVFESSELPPQAFPLGAPPLAFSAAASAAHAAVNAAATSVASTTASAGADAVKLLFGLVLLLVAGFAYWVSPAYERLYQKLFGRLDHY